MHSSFSEMILLQLMFLFLFQVTTQSTSPALQDIYRLPFGIRSVEVKGTQFLINNKPFYFKGFGKHEDADVRDVKIQCF